MTEAVEATDTAIGSDSELPNEQSIGYPKLHQLLAWVTCLGWSAALMSLWIQFRVGVYDTWDALWLPFAGLGLIGSVAIAALNSPSLFRRGHYRLAIFRLGIALTPLLSAIGWTVYMFFYVHRGFVPNNEVHKIGRMAAVTAFKCDARLRYPNRIESNRLIMYYDVDVTDPQGDLQAMENHLVHMEQVLGRSQREPIHYIRGSAFGLRAMSLQSVALSNHVSPATWFDRHELAHSFLYQFYDRETAPPTLLLEGWAMAMDGRSEYPAATALLARRNLQAHGSGVECLRWILSPERYGWANEPCEAIAPAFVQFVLARHGGNKFVALYNLIRPHRVEAAFLDSLGSELSVVEQQFWEYCESIAEIEIATKAVNDWILFLRNDDVTTEQRALNDREVLLLEALSTEERVELVNRQLPARLDELAQKCGLTTTECEQRLRFVGYQLSLVKKSIYSR